MIPSICRNGIPYLVSAICACLVFADSVALAQARASVRLGLDACPTLAAERVRSIVGAELGAQLLADGDTTSVALTEVDVACTDTTMTIIARDAESGQDLVREVTLDDVHPLARDRLAALAISELVTAVGFEILPPEPAPEVSAEPVAAPPEEPPEEVEVSTTDIPARPRRTLALLGSAAFLSSPTRGAYGAALRFERGFGALFGLGLGVAGEHSKLETAAGDITSLQFALALDATLGVHREAFALEALLGLSFGVARLHGEPTEDDVTGGTLVAPLLIARLGGRAFVSLGRRLFLTAALELGVVLVSAHALVDETRTMSIRGATVTGQLGLGFSL